MSDTYQPGKSPSNSPSYGGASGHIREGFDETKSTSSDPQKAASGASGSKKSASADPRKFASDITNSSTEAVRAQASNAADAVRAVASQASEKINQTVADRKSMGADYVSNIASVVRRAGDQFDHDLPIAGRYIRMAADQMESSADAIRSGNVSDIVHRAQSFARSQPTAFLALSMLAGFGVVRFLKSGSTSASDGMSSGA